MRKWSATAILRKCCGVCLRPRRIRACWRCVADAAELARRVVLADRMPTVLGADVAEELPREPLPAAVGEEPAQVRPPAVVVDPRRLLLVGPREDAARCG